MHRRSCPLVFLLTRSSSEYYSSRSLRPSCVNRIDYSPSDGDLAMYDLGGDHWPPQYANGCAVPVTESTHEKQYCIHS
jgi:hypothetical protein